MLRKNWASTAKEPGGVKKIVRSRREQTIFKLERETRITDSYPEVLTRTYWLTLPSCQM